jgi:hypothetical protein
MSVVEINRELCAIYGQNVMSEGAVRQWCRMFRDGQTNVCDIEHSGQPPAVSDDYVQNVDQKICRRECLTMSELSCEFLQISCKMDSENAHRCTQNADNCFITDLFFFLSKSQKWQ